MAAYSITEHASLKELNTFHIDAKAAWFTTLTSVEALSEMVQDGVFRRFRYMLMGGGSNMLFTRDFDGLIIKNELHGIYVVEENDHYVWVQAAAGESWHKLVLFCVGHGYSGIENLSLIPGTTGAAPIQNIGAYGVELKDVFHSLEAVNLFTGKNEIFDKEACAFGYRDSIFKNEHKGKYCITSITLQLKKYPELNVTYGAIRDTLDKMGVVSPGIKDISDAVMRIRRSKLPDPHEIGNAGSFFKNPEISAEAFAVLKSQFPEIPGYPTDHQRIKVPAGWLIEQCGWKGKRVGNTGSHKDQALVLVNYGNATGNEIYALALEIQSSVLKKFGINIHPEVNII